MSSKVCLGLIALPVFLCNVSSSFASGGLAIFPNQISVAATLMNASKHYELTGVPFQLSAIDDQTEDCLRAGNCKD